MLIFDSQKSWSPRTSLSPHFRPSSPSQSSWSSSDRWSSTLLIIVVKAGLVTLTFGGQAVPVAATVLLNSLFITSSATSAFPVDACSTPSIHNQYGKTVGLFFLLYPMLVCFSTRSMVISTQIYSNLSQRKEIPWNEWQGEDVKEWELKWRLDSVSVSEATSAISARPGPSLYPELCSVQFVLFSPTL